jgi:hypothetical protein
MRLSRGCASFGGDRRSKCRLAHASFGCHLNASLLRPSESLPEIWGDNIILNGSFGKQPVLQDFLSLIMRHWNVIADTLYSGDVFLPLLLEADDGATPCQRLGDGFSSWNGVS